jgi:hypothetical protein
MSEMSSTYFEKAKTLEVNQALFIRVADKKEQTALANELQEDKDAYAAIEPVHASQLFINKILKDRKQYVTIERKYRAPFTVFIKGTDGSFTKEQLDPDRHRILKLMLKDGKLREEIESVLNGLTDEEIKLYFPDEK